MAHVIGDGADKDSLTGYSMMRFAERLAQDHVVCPCLLTSPVTNLEPRMIWIQ